MNCPLCKHKTSFRQCKSLLEGITRKDMQWPMDEATRKALVSAMVKEMSPEERLSLRGTLNSLLRENFGAGAGRGNKSNG
jgi:hypothetical protein